MESQFVKLVEKQERIEVGDVFCYRLVGPSIYGFGLLAQVTKLPQFEGACVVYFFCAFAEAAFAPGDAVRNDRLLVSPLLIDETLWTDGFCKVVERGRADLVLPNHCFRCDDFEAGPVYYDENGESTERFEPVLVDGVTTMSCLDEPILEAMAACDIEKAMVGEG